MKAGVGICLTGGAEMRSDLLALQAKGFAVAGQPVFYCTLHALIHYLEYDDDRRKMMTRCRVLFIDGFEKEFREDECPYTLYQRMEIEDFLKARNDSGRINNYSACRRWSGLRWWSADFVNSTAQFTRDIALV